MSVKPEKNSKFIKAKEALLWRIDQKNHSAVAERVEVYVEVA